MSSLSGNQGPRIRAARDSGGAAPYEAITLDRVTPVIGAEIGGVDLGNLSNRQFDEIHRALAEHGAIFFRDQRITPEQHLAFGRRFGELHRPPGGAARAGPPGADGHQGRREQQARQRRGLALDVSCDEEPPMGSVLYIKECPPPAATRSSPACTRPTTRCRTG
jgi:taurine dioxygenase